MNIQSIIVLLLVLAVAGWALWTCIRNRKNETSCCGREYGCACTNCKDKCKAIKKD